MDRTGSPALSEPIVIRQQGSFFAGGAVVSDDGPPTSACPYARTLHGDHAYVSYQVPEHSRCLPLVFLHGNSQSAKTWETTPDGREGFQTIFLRRAFSTYLVDQPRRGRAGRSTASTTISIERTDQTWFDTFRLGIWPEFFPDVQFPRSPEALDQYFRQITPDTGPFDLDVSANAMAALFERIGKGILVTHSRGGGVGWSTAIRTKNVRSIISYEPGSNFPFPASEVPSPLSSAGGTLEGLSVPAEQFEKLLLIPIALYYGDYIPEEPVESVGQDIWRMRLEMARIWADLVNRSGGNVQIFHLPKLGINGNTHFPFSDLNNIQIADLMSQFLSENNLDLR